MAREDVELLRTAHEDFRQSGEDAIDAYLDPDVELTAIEEMPGNRTHRGPAGFHDWFQILREAFGDFTWEPLNFAEVGEHVLVETRFIAQGRESGVPVEVTVHNLWTVKDGKVTRVRGYLDRSEALAAAGATPRL